MKFLIGVLVIRFLIEVVSRKENKGNVQHESIMNCNVRHPAEFELR